MGNKKENCKQQSIRFPLSLYDYIDSIPSGKYGIDFTSKVITLLYLGKEKLIQDELTLKNADQCEKEEKAI